MPDCPCGFDRSDVGHRRIDRAIGSSVAQQRIKANNANRDNQVGVNQVMRQIDSFAGC